MNVILIASVLAVALAVYILSKKLINSYDPQPAVPPPLPNVNPIAETDCGKCGHHYTFNLTDADPHCPLCGYSALPQKQRPPLPASQSVSASVSTAFSRIAICFVVAVVAFFLFGRDSQKANRQPPAAPDHAMDAWYMSRQFVETRLAPKKTSFPNPKTGTDFTGSERDADGSFKAWGYVDTVNDFNAPIRRYWVAHLKPAGADQWQLLNLVFKENQ